MVETKKIENVNEYLDLLKKSEQYISEHFIDVPTETLKSLLLQIDKEDLFMNEIIKEKELKKSIIEYCEIILKIKSLLMPSSVEKDKIVKLLFDGKIQDGEIIENIMHHISFETICNIIEFKEGEENFLSRLAEFLKRKSVGDDIIGKIVRNLINRETLNYELSELLVTLNRIIDNDKSDEYKINIEEGKYRESAEDLQEILLKYKIFSEHYDRGFSLGESKEGENNKWISEIYYDIKKKEIENIKSGESPFVSVEYYCKIIQTRQYDEEWYIIMCENAIELLQSSHLNENEKNKLRKALKENTEFGDYITDNDVELSIDIDHPDKESFKKMYYNGKRIPYALAIDLIKEIFFNQEWIDFKREDIRMYLKASIKSIIFYKMKELGIDINIFFGNDSRTNKGYHAGYYNTKRKTIWLNLDSLNPYKHSPASLFNCIIHEMNHAVQNYSISNGKIDYLTFLMLEENLVDDYDNDYYKINYAQFFKEIDSRIEGMTINSLGVGKMQLEWEYDTEKDNLLEHLRKLTNKIKLGDKEYEIPTSKLLGKIIEFNPSILEENKVLKIKYNKDGSEKDIQSLLNDFERITEGNQNEYKIQWDYLYLIYSGIINHRANFIEKVDEELKSKIEKFNEMNLVSIVALKQYYDLADTQDLKELISRLDATKVRKDIEESKGR